MKSSKRIISGLLMATMLLGGIGVYAYVPEPLSENETLVDFEPDVSFEAETLSDEDMSCTEAADAIEKQSNAETDTESSGSQVDISEWNMDILEDTPPEVYENFPVIIEQKVESRARLNLFFIYAKNISDGDIANLEIIDEYDNTIISGEFTQDSIYIPMYNVGVNRIYTLKLTEVRNGETVTTVKYLQTENKRTTFPSNILDDPANPQGTLQAEQISLREVVADKDETTVETSFIEESDFNSFYEELSKDKLYYTTATVNGVMYDGYISTAAGGETLGVYKPLAIFYDEYPVQIRPLASNGTVITKLTPSELMAEAKEYKYMQDALVTLSRDKDYFAIKFVAPDQGAYIIETKGNYTVEYEVWDASSDGKVPTYSEHHYAKFDGD